MLKYAVVVDVLKSENSCYPVKMGFSIEKSIYRKNEYDNEKTLAILTRHINMSCKEFNNQARVINFSEFPCFTRSIYYL
jgi:hypothetical protein